MASQILCTNSGGLIISITFCAACDSRYCVSEARPVYLWDRGSSPCDGRLPFGLVVSRAVPRAFLVFGIFGLGFLTLGCERVAF